MSQATSPGSLQYMIDVGVPQDDVIWLQRIAKAPVAQDATVRERIARIHEKAYQGLLSFARPADTTVLQ